MNRRTLTVLAGVVLLCGNKIADAEERVLTPRLHHLRTGPREWSDFPAQPEGTKLALKFPSDGNPSEWALRLRQQDVRQTWKVLLNGKELVRLSTDENDLVIYVPIPVKELIAGENTLTIEQVGVTPDDVRIGEISVIDQPVKETLSAATVEINVIDADQKTQLPCRLTIVNKESARITVGAVSQGQLAVRPGVIYTGNGRARFGLPAGEYVVYAGRGFEYSLDSIPLSLKPGDVVRKTLRIRREVDTKGYVSCDTHIHTLTYSGHGDASVDEQMLTIAGEGIELPIATEHNRQIDYHAAAVKQQVRKYFTPVVGNEVTTSVGHFNVFPVAAGDDVPDFKLKDWKSIFASIKQRTAAPIVILNHPRDKHSGFTPFGPARHNALVGENLDGWKLEANGMEVVNSGAIQSDTMRLYHDWFGLLNRGIVLTPVGGSDSHDVARFFVGQARTYIRCNDDNPGNIDVAQAVKRFQEGRVAVSCGLFTEIRVNGKHGPGDLVPRTDEIEISVRVLGPSWVKADKVELYANGSLIRTVRISDPKAPVQWSGTWKIPCRKHDFHLVAIASGPGVTEAYWPIARPYQATSPHVERRIVGSTGAVWIDGDGDGKRTSAHGYAQRTLQAKDSPAKLIDRLSGFDEATAAQFASLLQHRGMSVQDAEMKAAAHRAGPQVERGFAAFAESWRECQTAKSERH
jgi:hypothetical protein